MTFYNLIKIAHYRGIEKTALRNIFRKALMFPGHPDPKMAKMTVGQYQKMIGKAANNAYGNTVVQGGNRNLVKNQQTPKFEELSKMNETLQNRLNELNKVKGVGGKEISLSGKVATGADDYTGAVSHIATEKAKESGTYVGSSTKFDKATGNPTFTPANELPLAQYGDARIDASATQKMLREKYTRDPIIERQKYSKMDPNSQQRRDYDAQQGLKAQTERRAKFDKIKEQKAEEEARRLAEIKSQEEAAQKLEASKPKPKPVEQAPVQPPVQQAPVQPPVQASPDTKPTVGAGSNILRNTALAAGGIGLGYGAKKLYDRHNSENKS